MRQSRRNIFHKPGPLTAQCQAIPCAAVHRRLHSAEHLVFESPYRSFSYSLRWVCRWNELLVSFPGLGRVVNALTPVFCPVAPQHPRFPTHAAARRTGQRQERPLGGAVAARGSLAQACRGAAQQSGLTKRVFAQQTPTGRPETITPAGIATAPSAKVWHAPSGSKAGRPNCWPSNTFTSSSRCPNKSPNSPSTTRT